MYEKLLIIGASGHGKVVADIAFNLNKWHEINFLDDNPSLDEVLGFNVIGNTQELGRYLDTYDIFVAIGDNQVRKKIQTSLEEKAVSIPTLIHPAATIGREVDIGSGTVIMANAVVNSASKIGKGCIINTGATVDHDNLIEPYTHISPGAVLSGTVHIGEASWIGAGSTISNNIKIVNHSLIGAGAVVVNDITESGVYIGTPARKMNGE